MAAAKYQKMYAEMITSNAQLFSELKLKGSNPKSLDFKEAQHKVLRLIHSYENQLCSKTESARFSNFSAGLAAKFWEKIRADYPEVDYSAD